MSWASVAKKEPQLAAVQETAEPSVNQQSTTAVIDANAIIAGMRMDGIADQICTIPEVLQEIKDKKSRENLEAFPQTIKVIQPTEESVRAGASKPIQYMNSRSIVPYKLARLGLVFRFTEGAFTSPIVVERKLSISSFIVL